MSATGGPQKAILSVNAGSSSLKFALYPVRDGQVLPAVLSGNMEGLEPGGRPVMGWHRQGQSHRSDLQVLANAGVSAVFATALKALERLLSSEPDLPALAAVAHRVVHGGSEFCESVVVTSEVLSKLAALNSLAPLHQPHNLAGIRAFASAFEQVPQVACFDTAFHATVTPVERAFALPAQLSAEGLVRYGFHGLSYHYIMSTLQEHSVRAGGKVLMAHLGNGASLCAAQGGRSCATTMGFSALDGLMMGTRAGSLDAGVLLYLLERGWTHDQLQTLLYRQSGLLGVSGISADMRRLEADGSEAARFAIDLFVHRVVRETGALAACLGGLDVLAFSGGIGEHSQHVRAAVCQRLRWLGVELDDAANQAASGVLVQAIHSPASSVEVWVVPTDEGKVAAREALKTLNVIA